MHGKIGTLGELLRQSQINNVWYDLQSSKGELKESETRRKSHEEFIDNGKLIEFDFDDNKINRKILDAENSSDQELLLSLLEDTPLNADKQGEVDEGLLWHASLGRVSLWYLRKCKIH